MAVLQVVLKTFLIKLFSWRFLFGCKMGSSSVLLSKMKPSINFSMGISVIVKNKVLFSTAPTRALLFTLQRKRSSVIETVSIVDLLALQNSWLGSLRTQVMKKW